MDLNASNAESSDGLTWDPEDQWLWRLSAEALLDPPILPSGLWIGAEIGLGVLREVGEYVNAASQIKQSSAVRTAPLLGLGLGWDCWLGDSFTLTPELRFQVIVFDDPPELRPDVMGRDYGTSTWVEIALRLAYVF
jgi:hypothetical protein